MKIKELKEILNKYPDETRVLVDGYEGDYDDIHSTDIIEVIGPHRGLQWIGEYKSVRWGQEDDISFDALLLSRGWNENK